ncbi:MAG: PIN domain nuclease [Clostridiaceae bacterium]|nr:PIN domain nuclease [Clostridiaceae bacterium]
MQDTLRFWEEIKKGKYEVFISDVTFNELVKCNEPKRTALLSSLSQIDFLKVEESKESLEVSERYIEYGVLNKKSYDDCRHMAIATVINCDLIVSWNFKHFVNIKTMTKLQAVNKLLGFREVLILPPVMMLEGDEEE